MFGAIIPLLGVVGGLALGFGLAAALTVFLVKKSNDVGADSGTMKDFGAELNMIDSTNDTDKKPADVDAKAIFEEHLKEIKKELNQKK